MAAPESEKPGVDVGGVVGICLLALAAVSQSCRGAEVATSPATSTGPAASITPSAATSAATVAPPPPPTPAFICQQAGRSNLDLTQLRSADYWTFSQPGQCYDAYGNTEVGCQFLVAFCKQLPPDAFDGRQGIGIGQISTLHDYNSHFALGGLSQIHQSGDDALLAKFIGGDFVICPWEKTFMQANLTLKCDPDAQWPTPEPGQPGQLPVTKVYLDEHACTFVIEANYDGVCPPIPPSPGTILIIIFFGVVTLYLVGGIAYKTFTGAVGWEVIPNYNMWKMVLVDIREGCHFAWDVVTCRKYEHL